MQCLGFIQFYHGLGHLQIIAIFRSPNEFQGFQKTEEAERLFRKINQTEIAINYCFFPFFICKISIVFKTAFDAADSRIYQIILPWNY